MRAFVLRRTAGAAVTFVAATVVVFAVTFALPGDPARRLAGRRGASAATLRAIRTRYHLDDPLPVRYARWLGQLLRGDLGESYASRRPVREMLVDALPVTMKLLIATVLIEAVLGLVVGAAIGRRPGSGLDRVAVAACTLAIAAPVFVVASLVQLVVGVRWQWLPVAGTADGWRSFVLPAAVLALPGLAFAIRIMRVEVIDQYRRRHIDVARAKGLREGTITRRHVVRNSIGPFVTFMGLEVAALAGGSVVVERVFNLPGVGGQTARAISQRDVSLLVGFTVAVIAAYLLVDLVVDLALMWVDPRLVPSEQ
jgi:ABC-type dipeptide/oligopeptide/nickel transport system permease component